MVARRQLLAVDPEDLRVAKGIASFKGMTLKKYFRSIIDEEAKHFQQDLPNYRRKR